MGTSSSSIERIIFTSKEVRLLNLALSALEADFEGTKSFLKKLNPMAQAIHQEMVETLESIKPKIKTLTGSEILKMEPVTEEDMREFTNLGKE